MKRAVAEGDRDVVGQFRSSTWDSPKNGMVENFGLPEPPAPDGQQQPIPPDDQVCKVCLNGIANYVLNACGHILCTYSELPQLPGTCVVLDQAFLSIKLLIYVICRSALWALFSGSVLKWYG